MTREPPHPARTQGAAVDSQGAIVVEAHRPTVLLWADAQNWLPVASPLEVLYISSFAADSSTTVLNEEQNIPHTPLAMTRDVDPNELQRQMVGEQYSQNMDDVFNRQHEAYGDRKMAMVIANLNDQENETQTPVSMSIDSKELRRQRDRERYAQNRMRY
ncbi:hypothetical protein ZWY2020_023464 [Hordeum vulgare]|nr:hypothetical protein ZWY2020_023464 [Hordeum vulgare]